MTARPVILITGAAGRIGGHLRATLPAHPALAAHYPGGFGLRVTDILDPGPGEGEVAIGDLAQPDFVDSLFADGRVVALIHLAGYPREAQWEVLLDANIRATINLWEAARRAGAQRALYASSNHAIGLYPRARRIDHRVPTRPDSRYGLTKVFGEQLGFLYAHKFGLRFFGMRIGMFTPEPTSHRGLSTWLSPADLTDLVRVGLTADYACEIVYGVSDNARSFWDNGAALRLGYRPQDRGEAHAGRFAPPEDSNCPAERFQGGPYVENGLVGDANALAALERDDI